jgi:hypothetical protein
MIIPKKIPAKILFFEKRNFKTLAEKIALTNAMNTVKIDRIRTAFVLEKANIKIKNKA